MFTIYKLESPEGKVYIGCTKHNRLKYRFGPNGEGYGHQSRLWEAIQRLGWEQFSKVVLDQVNTREEASELERYYIQKYNAQNPDKGYNVRPGGIGSPLPSVPPEIGEKISRSKKGCVWIRKGDQIKQVRLEEVTTFEAAGWHRGCRNLTESEKRHLREINTGKRYSPTTKAKLSAIRTGKVVLHRGDVEYKVAPEQVEELLAQGYELGRPAKTIQRMRETQLGRKQSEETKAKRSKSMIGKLVGRKQIHKGTARKCVPQDQLASYLADGWELGIKSKGGN